MTGAGSQRPRILAAVDPCNPSARAALADHVLATAAALARAREAQLDVVHAWQAPGELLLERQLGAAELGAYLDAERRRAQERLDAFLARFGPIDRATPVLVHGRADVAIAEVARTRRVAAVVAGSSGLHRVSGRVLGDTATRLAAALPCPLVIVTSAHDAPDAILPRATLRRGAAR